MAIDHIEIAITKEGLESLAELTASSLVLGVASPIDFKIGYFQVGAIGDMDSVKVYQGDCTDVFYADYSAAAYQLAHTTDIVAVNSVTLIDSLTVEIECYMPPSTIVVADYPCDEIMVFTGDAILGYKSFAYGVFPTISKQMAYGLNFKITCRFGGAA